MRPRRMAPRRAWARAGLALLALAIVAGLAACDPRSGDATASEPTQNLFVSCPAPGPSVPASAAAPAEARDLVADLALPCAGGGQPVALRKLGQPAVLNLWASWCDPCRRELPEFQQLAAASTGQLLVLGVNTSDKTAASGALARGLGITFPTVLDSSGQLQRTVPSPTLPMTLFVDATGVVRHVDRSGALTLAELVDLVHQHLGLTVTTPPPSPDTPSSPQAEEEGG
jgi:thiol-disulfide isomerase/thioredoxin